ncbi:MAG: class I SAM-dependent methyltransferase [Woeseiaceae bacterium]|jgi:ubiquinone/menaquinone biosynthesis C-methylase UbiE
MSEQASRFVGSIPESYDKDLGPRIFFDYADDLARRATALRPKSVLELAAGTGIVSRRLRDSLDMDSHLVATDLNLPMLDVAKTKFRAGEAVSFEQADATDLNFDTASFDAVVCQFGVMFFPDKFRSYAEVHRVLRADGSYLFNVWHSWDANPFARIAHEAVAGFFPENPPGFYNVPFSYCDADLIRDSLLKAGFARVEFESLSLVSEIPSAKDFAHGLVFGNPLFEEIVTRGGDPQDICAAVTSAIDRELGPEMPLSALVCHAYKG